MSQEKHDYFPNVTENCALVQLLLTLKFCKPWETGTLHGTDINISIPKSMQNLGLQ